MVTNDPHPVVRVDLMKQALAAFDTVVQRSASKPRWSGKAEDAVLKAVDSEHWLIRYSYLKRCHAFRNMMKKGMPRALREWIRADGSLNDALIAAVALAPLRRDGKFRIKEFRDVAAGLVSSETPPEK